MHKNTEQPTTIFFLLTIDNKSHSIRAWVPTDMDILLSVPAPLGDFLLRARPIPARVSIKWVLNRLRVMAGIRGYPLYLFNLFFSHLLKLFKSTFGKKKNKLDQCSNANIKVPIHI